MTESARLGEENSIPSTALVNSTQFFVTSQVNTSLDDVFCNFAEGK